MDFSLTLIISFSLGFREKNIIKTKCRNCLKTETVAKLLRVEFNSGSVDKAKATEFFIAKKEKTFKACLESKTQYYYLDKQQNRNIFNQGSYLIMKEALKRRG